MIGKIVSLPFRLVSGILGLVFSLVKMVFSLGFGTFRLVINRVFGTLFGALIGFFLGKKHIRIKLFSKKK
ncbi:MAG: hypothetical protein JW863_09315 [Chitinispirillaceae bacterium]|jgi:hypothetical protein|nr:hypothetical protein [Chitinispirillaceae bacterium]